MKMQTSQVCLGLLFFVLVSSEQSCEEQVTVDMKFKLVKDSLKNVKTLFPKCRDTDDDDYTKCGKKDSASAYINLALDTLEGLKGNGGGNRRCPKCPKPGESGPIDCSEILDMGYNKSGVYTIYPRSRANGTLALDVYCDMDMDKGGWTVIQRRSNYTTKLNFHRDWESYKNGFGNLEEEFWLGNEYIYTLTNQGVYSLRVDLKSAAGEYRYSFHDNFWLSNESAEYVLHLADFTGNVTNDLQHQNNWKFSTIDRHNDKNAEKDACAIKYHGAWWYPVGSGCSHVNLNGMYIPGVNDRRSTFWWNWTGYVGLAFSEMKIRHRSPK